MKSTYTTLVGVVIIKFSGAKVRKKHTGNKFVAKCFQICFVLSNQGIDDGQADPASMFDPV